MALDTQTVWINAPVQTVFGYLTDVRRNVEWSGTIEYGLADLEVITPPPFGIGSRWRSRGRNFTDRLNEDESAVIEFLSPHTFGFTTRCTLAGGVTTFRHRYELGPENGGTRVAYSFISAKPHNFKAVLLLLSFMTKRRNVGKETVAGGLSALKSAVEQLPEVQAGIQ